MNLLRLSISLALLAGFPAQALLLQQGETRFDIDPATLQIVAGKTRLTRHWLGKPWLNCKAHRRRQAGNGPTALCRLPPDWRVAICA